MELSIIDNLILNIFESQSDEVFFPIVSQTVCKRFVKWLHEDGVSYKTLSNEVKESEETLNLWRRGMTKRNVGKKIMYRINRPINDFLESAETADENSYEALFSDEDTLGKIFEDYLKTSQPSNQIPNFSNDYKHIWNSKPHQISLIEEVNTDEECSNNLDNDLSSNASEKAECNLNKSISLDMYETCYSNADEDVISNSTSFTNGDEMLRNIAVNLADDSINAALISIANMNETFIRPQKKVVNTLSSDSFKSCSSTFHESQCMSGEGEDSWKVNKENNLDFDSFDETIDLEIYHKNNSPHFSTPVLECTQPPHCVYLLSQSLHNDLHRFKLGSTTDLHSVKKTASLFNLDLSLVTSFEVKDLQSSLSRITSSLKHFQINDFFWYEAAYVQFIESFNKAITNL